MPTYYITTKHEKHTSSNAINFQIFLSGKSSKFVIKRSLKTPSQVKHISQGSVTMHFMCGGSFNNHFIANLLLSVIVEEIGQHLMTLCQKLKWLTFVNHPV